MRPIIKHKLQHMGHHDGGESCGSGSCNRTVFHVPRVEGHGNIEVVISEGEIESLKWVIDESPRFFEKMIQGQSHEEVARIISRICGICGVGHTMASLQATERAFGIEISEQTRKLRKICVNGATLQSNILHVGVLVLPDLLGMDDMLELVKVRNEATMAALELKKLGNDVCDLIGGRTTHPFKMVVGGVTSLPDPDKLEDLLEELIFSRGKLAAVVEFMKPLLQGLPVFPREREFISLTHPDEYALYDGVICTNDGTADPSEYLKYTNEYMSDQSSALFSKYKGEPYMVGALARCHHNFDQLHPAAQAVAKDLGWSVPSYNPFDNNIAQLLECVHVVEDSIDIIEELLDHGFDQQELDFKVTPRAGIGVGAHEVPRGILYHSYEYDDSGHIVHANAVIPTNQNHAAIQQDFEWIVPQVMDRTEDEIVKTLIQTVHAYDPCISCSVHQLVKVQFK